MSFLLDTDVCVALLRRAKPRAAERVDAALLDGALVAVSTVSIFELAHGAAKSGRGDAAWLELEAFLSLFATIPFADGDGRVAGEIEWSLRRIGKQIGAYDVLIGSQALARDLTLVTGNVREFGRIEGLRVENWLA